MVPAIILGIVGIGAGFGASTVITKKKLGSAEDAAKKELAKAKKEGDKLISDAREKAADIAETARKEDQLHRKQQKELEARLIAREETIDKKLDDLDKRSEHLRKSESEVEDLKNEIRTIRKKQQDKLEKIAKLTKDEAADKLLKMTERDIKGDLTGLVSKLQNEAKENAEEQAALIITTAMERMSSEVTAERTVTAGKLDDEEMKGRIIGKEGRIEEVVEKAQKEVQKDIVRTAEDAAREVGIIGIPKEILQYLGELKFRTSYGQNVLKHSTEMAHIAGIIAEELGADVKTAKYAALVHDLGKALTHKMEGKHHHISGEILRKYGVPEDVAHAAEAHHDDMEATTTEALIVRVVDAISAARPGARNISAENFVERMKDLENVANGFEGIEKSYAISAGREVRIFVKPQDIDDLSAIKLARDIANKIESTMQYPGTIKVNVIRETRAIEFAK